MLLNEVITVLSNLKLPLEDEKVLQIEIFKHLPGFEREKQLDDKNIIDFFNNNKGIGIEVKIGSKSKKEIYRQCKRYCDFECIEVLILLTNKSMGLPPDINNKKTFIINLGKAWL